MRLALPTLALALVPAIACSEAVAKPKASGGRDPVEAVVKRAASIERPIAETPVEIAARRPPTTDAVGALERPNALRRFFEALARLDAGRAHDDVRVTQFGDSHTAADVQTAVVRRALQSRFGDGGRGFVAIGRPAKYYVQEGVRFGMSTDWSRERGKIERGKLTGDGLYGLAGIGLVTHQRGARAWSDVPASSARAELAYLEQPDGGAFDVFIDGVRLVRVATHAEQPASAFRRFDIADTSAHQLEVRAIGDGDVRVFGVALDRREHGVVLDALGINGARVSTALAWNEPHWAEQLAHRAPTLVVLAYGTNESTDLDMPEAAYERQLVDALGRVARAVPGASCLLLGPPDRAVMTKEGWVPAAKIAEIVDAQRRVAEAAGCAFYDQQAAMGGQGSIAIWADEEPPRAQKDRCHLTREGYAELGSAFASDLMRAYAAYRRGAGLGEVAARSGAAAEGEAPAERAAAPAAKRAVEPVGAF